MRITGLLVVLLLILLLFFVAPAASYAQTLNSAKAAPSAADRVDFDRAVLRNFMRGDGAQLERDGICYTMRTYVVVREDKDSDVERPLRVTRCLPATKLEFKSAVAPVRSEEDSREQR
jgi:hypothetical protein